MDWALNLVQGYRLAAAKLLDMEPNRFRNLVNYHRSLKEKWGRSNPGRPPGALNFKIKPYVEGRFADAADELCVQTQAVV